MTSVSSETGLADFLACHETVARPQCLSVGANAGEWRVTAFLGHGGSSEVYRVVGKDGTVAALKVLTKNSASSRRRFEQEIALFAVNVLHVLPRFFGQGEVGGRPFFVYELLEPIELPHDDAGVARYLLDVCRAVGVLHDVGLIHRDLKPSNIMKRSDGGLVLIDLGLVKDLVSNAEPETGMSIVSRKFIAMGTPAYAAPEQMQGGRVSPMADIHAIGRIANALLGGNASPAWADVIRRATCSIPALRYQSVEDLAHAIRHRHVRQHARWLGVVGACLAVGIVAGTVWWAARAVGDATSTRNPAAEIFGGDGPSKILVPEVVKSEVPRAVSQLDAAVALPKTPIPLADVTGQEEPIFGSGVDVDVEVEPKAVRVSEVFRNVEPDSVSLPEPERSMPTDSDAPTFSTASVASVPTNGFRAICFVNGATGSDANDGQDAECAKKTIQAAIDAASDGSTILVAPGTYEPIRTNNKPLTIVGVKGAWQTIIDGGRTSRCVTAGVDHAPKGIFTNTLVRGFTLRNGRDTDAGGGNIRFGIAERCVVENGEARGGGGACMAILRNCLVRNNHSWLVGGGGSRCVFINCTIVGNRAKGKGGAYFESVLRNCVVYANQGITEEHDGSQHVRTNSPIDLWRERRIGLRAGDPHFVASDKGDYRLAADSPYVDAGDNAYVPDGDVDLDGKPRIVNGRVDYGCFERADPTADEF